MAAATSISASPPLTASSSSSSSKNYSATFARFSTVPFAKRSNLLSSTCSSIMGGSRITSLKINNRVLSSDKRIGGVKCMASGVLQKALLFDCDGVHVDTEKDGHRISFNDTFAEKELGVTWDVHLYGELLKIGGGEERTTAYFNKVGWPEKAPKSDEERKPLMARDRNCSNHDGTRQWFYRPEEALLVKPTGTDKWLENLLQSMQSMCSPVGSTKAERRGRTG